MTNEVRELFKMLIAECGLFLALFFALVYREELKRYRPAVWIAAILCACAAVGAYFEFGVTRYGQYMNPHDVFHYYTGSKYARELGYYDQYNAALLADLEGRAVFNKNSAIRDLRDHSFRPVRDVLAERDRIRGKFSDARWAEFKKDILYFQAQVPASKWQQMLRDKGFNGTPVWTMVAGLFTERIPTHDANGMAVLVLLDAALLIIMFLAIQAVFGERTALLAIIFFGINFAMNFVHIKGALLRMDWLAAMTIAVCMLKAGRYRVAGGLLAYAAMCRVFPAIFLFGIGARAVWEFWQTRKVQRKYVDFAVAFGVAALALFGLSVWRYGGLQLWEEFGSKIGVHNNDISTTRVGFKYIVLWPYETATAKANAFAALAWVNRGFELLALLLTFLAARRMRDEEALAAGFVPFFFMTAPTFYYYVILIVPLMIFLPRLETLRGVVGVCLFFLTSLVAYVLHQFMDLNFALSFLLSCLYLAICVHIVTEAIPVGGVASIVRARRGLGVAAGVVIVLVAGALGVKALLPVSGTAAPPLAKEPGEVVLALAGDVMLSRNVARSVRDSGRGFTYPFAQAADLTSGADLAFCNVECPISGRGERIEKRYVFNAPAESVEGLRSAGFDVVSLANNHVLDYGPVALEDTVAHLQNAGVAPLGLVTGDAPHTPVIKVVGGVRVGFLAYTDPQTPYAYAKEFAGFPTGPAKADDAVLARDIGALRPQVDILVVSMHWGIEYETEPDDRQQTLGRYIIDQGADIVAGHHPHVQQRAEWYNDGLIIYSMGNFVFDQHTRPLTKESRLYRVFAGKQGIRSAAYLPMMISDEWQPAPNGADWVEVAR